MREYRTLRRLRAGEVIEIEGLRIIMDNTPLVVGDLYIAERNTGPKLLTVREIVMTSCGKHIDFVCPTTPDYAFDGHECQKVKEAPA